MRQSFIITYECGHEYRYNPYYITVRHYKQSTLNAIIVVASEWTKPRSALLYLSNNELLKNILKKGGSQNHLVGAG